MSGDRIRGRLTPVAFRHSRAVNSSKGRHTIAAEDITLAPQKGPQEQFLASSADIAIYGGGAGGGKSWGLLLEPIRHLNVKNFEGVIFRRTRPPITQPGGLWDESQQIFPMLGCKSREGGTLDWSKPGGMTLKFSGLQHVSDVYNWQGAQLAYLGFDELTHFAQKQFFYLLSRLRSTCGVTPYCRATCNPDAESWVAKFLEWWIDQETGLPIPERAGVLRYFIKQDDDLIWGDSREELIDLYGLEVAEYALSVTFIPAKVFDNQILMRKDPGYLAKLNAQSRVERARLLDGNWKIKATAGTIFKRGDFKIVPTAPHCIKWIRYWDRAATEPNPQNPNPDWTVGVKMGITSEKQFVIANVVRERKRPLGVQHLIENMASQDKCTVGLEKDPGQAGVSEAEALARQLNRYDVRIFPVMQDKVTRSTAYSAQVEAHNVLLVEGDWNEAFLAEHENFPPDETKDSKKKNNTESDEGNVAGKDDQVDAASGAFNYLNGDKVGKMVPPSNNESRTFAPGFNRGSLPEW